MGGLGNQVLQYNFGRYLEQRCGQSTYFVLDWYNKDNSNLRPPDKRLFLLNQVTYATNFVFLSNLIEKQIDVRVTNEEVYSDKHNLYIGHFISDQYTPCPLKIDTYYRNIVVPKNTCALHIRGGDYCRLGLELDQSYYGEVLSKIDEGIPIEVYTDDQQYAKTILGKCVIRKSRVISLPSGDEVDHYKAILASRYVICANSTYSLTAAIAASANGSICYSPAPLRYFKDLSCTDSRVLGLNNILVKHKIQIVEIR